MVDFAHAKLATLDPALHDMQQHATRRITTCSSEKQHTTTIKQISDMLSLSQTLSKQPIT